MTTDKQRRWSRESQARRRAAETPEQREARRQADRQRRAKARAAIRDAGPRGPKPLHPGETMVTVSAVVTESQRDYIKSVGGDNTSAGVRALVEDHAKK